MWDVADLLAIFGRPRRPLRNEMDVRPLEQLPGRGLAPAYPLADLSQGFTIVVHPVNVLPAGDRIAMERFAAHQPDSLGT